MKKALSFIYFLLLTFDLSLAQSVGIGTATPSASAKVDISSNNSGLLIPRMTTGAIGTVSNPAKGLLILDTTLNQLMVNMGTSSSPSWQTIVFKSGWSLGGNSNTNPASQFIGTTDNQPLLFRVNNVKAGEINPVTYSAFWGKGAGQNNSSGRSNVAIGVDALRSNQYNHNMVAVGDSALYNSSGFANTALGSKTLYSNSSGTANTGMGYQVLNNGNGQYNTAAGYRAMFAGGGNWNVGIGSEALYSNTSGATNIAVGVNSLYANTNGNDNVGIGSSALRLNTGGDENVAIGNSALYSNGLGNYNSAVGRNALAGTTASLYNTAIGYNAGYVYDMGYNNTILGANSIGAFNGQYNIIAIGQGVTCPDNSTVRIGNSASWSIGGYASWTNFSDGRYKKNIKEDVKGLEFILKLRPVTYNLDLTNASKKAKENAGQEWDAMMKLAIAEKENVIYTGFVAQEVEQAGKETGFDFSGVDKPRNEYGFYGLRYAEFVVPLVKAVQEQQVIIERQQKQINELLKRLEIVEKKMN
ncbi:MAG: tail fiber domain-containing protein [Chitinophagaceae bacterium]|nr:tail fiber domain-containing protein [Chitinophagaceae bacterium]